MAVDATIKASIIDGMTKIIAASEASLTYNAHAYTAGHGVLGTDRRHDIAGELEGYTDTYTILQSALTANSDAPAAGDLITTPQGVKRILRVRKDAFSACQRIDVGDRYGDR